MIGSPLSTSSHPAGVWSVIVLQKIASLFLTDANIVNVCNIYLCTNNKIFQGHKNENGDFHFMRDCEIQF